MLETIGPEGEQSSEDFEAPETGANEKENEQYQPESEQPSETRPSFQVSTEFEGKQISADVDIIACLWNSAEIGNIVNSILLSADEPQYMEQGHEHSSVFKALSDADPRLTMIAEYWNLYHQGLRQNKPEEKEVTARRMEEIRQELGVDKYPSTYFDPISRMKKFFPRTKES